VRRKQHLDDELVDQVVLTKYLGHAVDVDFEIRFAADFADIFEVRGARREVRGDQLPARVAAASVDLRYRGRDGCTYFTELRFNPPPRSLSEGSATFRVHLEHGESRLQEIVITPLRFAPGDAAELPPRSTVPFDVRVGRTRSESTAFER